MAGQNLLRFRSVLDDKVSSGLDRIHGKFDTFGKSKGFKSVAMGVGMGAGFGAWGALSSAIDKTVDFIGTSITAASDLNETISKSEVIFGDSGVTTWFDLIGNQYLMEPHDEVPLFRVSSKTYFEFLEPVVVTISLTSEAAADPAPEGSAVISRQPLSGHRSTLRCYAKLTVATLRFLARLRRWVLILSIS
jgi:hypothetical protein